MTNNIALQESGVPRVSVVVSDAELCHMSQCGDAEATEQLVRRYFKLVRRISGQFYLCGGDSEDLLQEGLLGLLKAIGTYSPDRLASFHTFATMRIRSKLMSAVKAANRDKHAPLNTYVSIQAPYPCGARSREAELCIYPECSADPESLIIGREEESELAGTCKALLSRLEAEIMGHYLEGLSYQEIATATRRSPKTVDNAVRRARKKLADYWR